jgi:hypothetical protein
MSLPELHQPSPARDEWASRRANNVRLGMILGGVVLALFLVAIWKYRPL